MIHASGLIRDLNVFGQRGFFMFVAGKAHVAGTVSGYQSGTYY
jgi:hypothetical protein